MRKQFIIYVWISHIQTMYAIAVYSVIIAELTDALYMKY